MTKFVLWIRARISPIDRWLKRNWDESVDEVGNGPWTFGVLPSKPEFRIRLEKRLKRAAKPAISILVTVMAGLILAAIELIFH